MLLLSSAFIGFSLIILIFACQLAIIFFTRAIPRPRKRRHLASASPVAVPQTPLVHLRVQARPITPCQLKNDLTCTGLYNCVHHPYPWYLYDDTLTRVAQFPKNQPGEGYCVPVKKRRCNKYTSDVAIVQMANYYDSICICKYPHLVTKETMFSDCDQRVACGEGQLTGGPITYNPLTHGTCVCPEGFVAYKEAHTGPGCRKATYVEAIQQFCSGGTVDPATAECTCPEGYLKVSPQGPLYVEGTFRRHLTTTICVKNPCMFSASHPADLLPYSSYNTVKNQCECDRLNGSFPVTSMQSIFKAPRNACQTFDTLNKYAWIKYMCSFYSKDDGSEGRRCWFVYLLYKYKYILGKVGIFVNVADDTQWADSIFPADYLESKLHQYVRDQYKPSTPGNFAHNETIHRQLGLKNYNAAFFPTLVTCQDQYKEAHHIDWGAISHLCKWDHKIYLSPSYAQNQNKNTFFIENAREILEAAVKDPSREVIPVVSTVFLKDRDPATVFPIGMIT